MSNGEGGSGCVVVGVGLWLVILPWAIIVYLNDSSFAHRAVATKALVTDSVPPDNCADCAEGSAVVTFQVHGKYYSDRIAFDNSPGKGEIISIGYDPRDPGHAVSPPPGSSPELGTIVLGILGLPPWLWLATHLLSRPRAGSR